MRNTERVETPKEKEPAPQIQALPPLERGGSA